MIGRYILQLLFLLHVDINFYFIINRVNQPVQKVMEIIEKTVDDATFSEWVERYDVLLYMLQNST